MASRRAVKGLARLEVVVVVLMGMLMLAVIVPACRHTRSDAVRGTCRANLARIGKAMLVYANDYQGKLPCSGGRMSYWGEVIRWNAPDRRQAFGLATDSSGGKASISSCFYLLVKYAGLRTRDFVCPGDAGTTEFKLSDVRNVPRDFQLTDAWDFGWHASQHCSYAYHLPFGKYALSTFGDPKMPVAADRNPWLNSPAGEPEPFALFKPDRVEARELSEATRHGNSLSHKREGQNVLFLDGHVSFEKRSDCGLDHDNIYTVSDRSDGGAALGTRPVFGPSQPMNAKDSLLVHDSGPFTTTVSRQAQEVDSKSLKQTAVVATLDCPLPEHMNVIWCSTFQMAWDKFKTDVIKEPIGVLGAEDLAGRLNRLAFPVTDIEPQSYYANAGFVKNGILEQIRKDMAKRFPSEPVPFFDDRYRQLPDVAMAYAYLNVDVGFEYPFYTYDRAFDFTDSNGTTTRVTAFCAQATARGGDYQNVRDQVEILHYAYGDTPESAEFVVDLCRHSQPYQVILARVTACNTLGETARAAQEKIDRFKEDPDYEALRKLRPIDRLTVPDVLYKLTHHFDELLGKHLGNERWRDHFIFEAIQKIDFTLSRTGVLLKSEARMGTTSGRSPEELAKPRHLHFDRPFLICVKKREPKATPFFLMWVDNAELMKTHP